jgi:hypothetical protein
MPQNHLQQLLEVLESHPLPKHGETRLKMVEHKPSFTEFCEGCGRTQENVRDLELQNATGRQLLRTFLCQPCRSEAATLFLREAQK